MPATYSLPVFNIVCNIWRNGNLTSNPPDVISICNLAVGRRTGTLLTAVPATSPTFGGM